MKKLRLILAATAIVPILALKSLAANVESVVVSRPAQAVGFTQSIDLSGWDRFSAQAVYSDGTPSSFTVTSGSRASATITVGSNPSGLIQAQASMTVNIKSTTSISGESVTLNGVKFVAGTDFTVGATTTTTAANLAAKIDAHSDFAASSSGSTVTVRYALYGESGNGLPAVTSSASKFGLSAATFSGGINSYSFFVNGTEFKEGTDWGATSSSPTTAINISTAINANATVNTQVIASTTSLGVVTIKAIASGLSIYSLAASTTGLSTSTGFPGGTPSDINLTTDVFTHISHGLTTGLRVFVSTNSGSVPTGLTNGGTYYAIKLNEDRYQLATTTMNAVAGTAIDITDVTSGSSISLRPAALTTAANNGFFWEASNDNVNFSSLSTVTYSSVTYSAAGNTLWDFGAFNYKYLRVNFTPPTTGGIALNVKLYGKKD